MITILGVPRCTMYKVTGYTADQNWTFNCCQCPLCEGQQQLWSIFLLLILLNFSTYKHWFSSVSAWASWHFPKTYQSCSKSSEITCPHISVVYNISCQNRRKKTSRDLKSGLKRGEDIARQTNYICSKGPDHYESFRIWWVTVGINQWNNSPMSSDILRVFFISAMLNLRVLAGMKKLIADSYIQT